MTDGHEIAHHPATRDRSIGALVGLAVGDAVGTTLEFRAPGTFDPIDDMVGGGPFHLSPGQFTDDTSMAMCLAESILDNGELLPADQLRRYVGWMRHGYWSSNGLCFDIGNTTSRALHRFERDASITDPVVDQTAAANGSLMRLAPVPIRWHTDVGLAAERSAESSRTTHPARRPVDACRVLGAMIAALVQGQPADVVLSPGFWQYGPLDPEVEAVARGSWLGKRAHEVRGRGFCVDALEAAIWAVAGASDFRHAVLRAANLGDDADTTAAIAGQLAGARWGAAGIPPEWRRRLVLPERITAIAGRLHDAGSGAGSGSGSGVPSWEWADDTTCHAYWVYPGSVLAGEYPGHHDPAIASRTLNLLVDHGVRTFVDLTTPADGLAPYGAVMARIADRRGLDLRHAVHPIPDMGVLAPDRYDAIVATIRAAARRGAVYAHCWGGIGRTGTVVACLLTDDGLPADVALARLTALRAASSKADRPSPETAEQVAVVHARAQRR